MKMTKHGLALISLAIVIFMTPHLAYAHGVKGIVDEGGIVVTAQYDNGEAMSYAKVKISAPGAELSFQSGRTDRNGRFCFFPDAAGDWQVIVDDEMGHRLKVAVPVNEARGLSKDPKDEKPAGSSMSKYEKAIIGIAIIFGISGSLFWWRGKRLHASLADRTRQDAGQDSA